ncbi:hypothetical protein GGH93_005955, partial [Coemansia aciculifera]
VYKAIRKDNPGIQRNEAQRLAGLRWKNLSEEDRRPFKDHYDALNKQYKIDKAAYDVRLKVYIQAKSRGSASTSRHAELELESLTPSDGAIERVLGLKPKPPLSINKLYHRDHAKATSAQNPDLNYEEVRQLIDAQWGKVSDEERQQYKERSSELYRQYKIDIAAYDARVQALISTAYGVPNTPHAVDEILERELGPKPKPPTRAQSIYRGSVIGDIRKENPGIHAVEAQRLAGIRWKNLSEEDRRPFKDRHDARNKQYKIDKAAYDARERSSGAVAPTHPLAISWPAEATLPDESPESTSLPANSGGLPGPTMATERPMSPIQESVAASATLAQPVVPLESIPVDMRPMSLESLNTTETAAFFESPDLSFSLNHPAADVKPPVESAESADPLTPTKAKSKKKKKRLAAEDDDQSTSPQRKKAKRAKGDAKEGKKKHKPKIVVKTEDNI